MVERNLLVNSPNKPGASLKSKKVSETCSARSSALSSSFASRALYQAAVCFFSALLCLATSSGSGPVSTISSLEESSSSSSSSSSESSSSSLSSTSSTVSSGTGGVMLSKSSFGSIKPVMTSLIRASSASTFSS